MNEKTRPMQDVDAVSLLVQIIPLFGEDERAWLVRVDADDPVYSLPIEGAGSVRHSDLGHVLDALHIWAMQWDDRPALASAPLHTYAPESPDDVRVPIGGVRDVAREVLIQYLPTDTQRKQSQIVDEIANRLESRFPF